MRKLSVFFIAIAFLLGAGFGGVLIGSHVSLAAEAQTADPAESKPEAGGTTKTGGPPPIHHILLEVSNMQTSIGFYRDILGFRPESLGRNFSTLKGVNVDIYLSTSPWGWKGPRAKDERLGLGMYPHFEVPNVEELVARFKKAGYRIVQEPRKYGWGTEAFVTDPDGYTWALVTLPKK